MALVGFVVLVLILIAPVLVVVAAGLLALAWHKPHWVAPRLQHRWLDRIASWMRASPMRFAVIVFALTLPFNWAVQQERLKVLKQFRPIFAIGNSADSLRSWTARAWHNEGLTAALSYTNSYTIRRSLDGGGVS